MYNDPSSRGSSDIASTGDEAKISPVQTSVRLVSLIDYEYSGYNPRGYDVGNHFCEWMADYATAEPHALKLERYPTMEERQTFCRAYLGAMHNVSCVGLPSAGSRAAHECHGMLRVPRYHSHTHTPRPPRRAHILNVGGAGNLAAAAAVCWVFV